jgi:hypothetical protein
LEVDYALKGTRDVPIVKGKKMEAGIAEKTSANPKMDSDFIHMGGPGRPDFVPRTPDGLDYDFIHNKNFDVFPLTKAQINKHIYGRPYGFTMEGIFYVNPKGWRTSPADIARLRKWVQSRP